MKRREFIRACSSSPILFLNTAGGTSTLPGSAAQGTSSPGMPGGQLYTRRRLDADVLVAGGGLAGVCAAISAARNGASVILVQDRSRLGGNSSSEIRIYA